MAWLVASLSSDLGVQSSNLALPHKFQRDHKIISNVILPFHIKEGQLSATDESMRTSTG